MTSAFLTGFVREAKHFSALIEKLYPCHSSSRQLDQAEMLTSLTGHFPAWRRFSKIACVVGLIIVVFQLTQTVGADETEERLFIDEPVAKLVVPNPPRLAANRVRTARLNAPIFSGPSRPSLPQNVVLNLFSDLAPIATIDKATTGATGASIYHGHIDSSPLSRFIIVHKDGIVAASVFIPETGVVQVQYAGNGLHRIIELDPSNGRLLVTRPAVMCRRDPMDDRIVKNEDLTPMAVT